jgi:general secretion pathway protein D
MTSPTRRPGRHGDPSAHRLAIALLVAVVPLAGCATTHAGMTAGTAAERQEDYDRAVLEFSKVVRERPDDLDARLALERASLRAAQAHYERGRRLDERSHYAGAVVEYQIAADLNPTSGAIADALRATRLKVRAGLAARPEGVTELESLIARSADFAPEGLEFPIGAALPESIVFRDASSRDVFAAIGQFSGVSVLFDPMFRATPVSIDLRSPSLEAALQATADATNNFVRVTAEDTITIVPDAPGKREEYGRDVVRTFYLSNADIEEAIDLLRIVMDLRRIAPMSATNAITVMDTPERVTAAARVIDAIDKARPEVIIEVELLEVDRQQLREYGLQFASPGSPGLDGAFDANAEGLTLEDVTNLTQGDIFVTNLPGLYYRLLKRDGNTRTLANPHLRTSEGLSAQARFGERVPVPVTTFAPIATGGVAQQPITSFNYENIGVNIDITPRTHHDGEVSLALQVEISNISGTGFGDLPTFGNRFINTTIRLKDGETNLLAGLIRDDERTVLDGIPGLSDIPVVGRLFARNKIERQTTDIVLTLTPHIVRELDLDETDLRPFIVERDPALGFDDFGTLPSDLPDLTADEFFDVSPILPPPPPPDDDA